MPDKFKLYFLLIFEPKKILNKVVRVGVISQASFSEFFHKSF